MTFSNEGETKGTFLVIKSDVLLKANETSTSKSSSEPTSLPSSPSSPTYIHCNSDESFDLRKLTLPTPTEDQGYEISSGECASSKDDDVNLVKVPLIKSRDESTTDDECNAMTIAKEENLKLNLHLGLPFDPRKVRFLRLVCKILSFALSLVENHLFKLTDSIPLSLRQAVILRVWKMYFPIHKLIFSNKVGIHPHASYEYHAMTSVMYWGRMFPVSIKRMRFMLSQLCCYHTFHTHPVIRPNHCKLGYERCAEYSIEGMRKKKFMTLSNNNYGLNAFYVHKVNYDMSELCTINDEQTNEEKINLSQKVKTNHLFTPFQRKNAPFATNAGDMKDDPTNVTGYYIQHHSKPSSKVILWLYGGAYLSGDSKGNMNFAEKIGQQCNYMDVFLCDYRLLPEYTFFDAIYDVCLAYEYLITVQGYHPQDVMLYGISSGGGISVRLLQRIVEYQKEDVVISGNTSIVDPVHNERLKKMEVLKIAPSGAFLMSPFVDYTNSEGSFQEYVYHDLVVNQSVYEEGVPYFKTVGSDKNAWKESPVNRSLKGLPPLCITTSAHECVFDHNIALCNKARKEGVEVDLGVWKYMFHVWPVFCAFLPEAKQAVDFTCNWIKRVSFQE